MPLIITTPFQNVPEDINDLTAQGIADGLFAFRQAGEWVGALPGAVSLGDTYTASYGDATPVDFFTVGVGFVLHSLRVTVLQTFDGTGAQIILGTPADSDYFFTASDTELLQGLSFDKVFSDEGPVTLRLTITPGFGGTQGMIQIQTSVLPN